MGPILVRELSVFPVKGCQANRVDRVEVTYRGVAGDRGFMLWADERHVDQLETPRLAAFGVSWTGDGALVFSHPEKGEYIHRPRGSGERRKTRYILDEFDVVDQGDEVAAWLGAILEKDVRLVASGPAFRTKLPLEEFRLVDGTEKDRFWAASPVSLANTASLDDLNQRLEQPVGMDRFRMNVVLEGLEPWQEDEIRTVSRGDLVLERATVCERCLIVTTDQKTGERPKSDLMKVLNGFRRRREGAYASGIVFGAYMAVKSEGALRVGDTVEVELR